MHILRMEEFKEEMPDLLQIVNVRYCCNCAGWLENCVLRAKSSML